MIWIRLHLEVERQSKYDAPAEVFRSDSSGCYLKFKKHGTFMNILDVRYKQFWSFPYFLGSFWTFEQHLSSQYND